MTVPSTRVTGVLRARLSGEPAMTAEHVAGDKCPGKRAPRACARVLVDYPSFFHPQHTN
jgi:hypothetical protein